MEAVCCSHPDNCTLEVNQLLEEFGSSLSLEDIASALKQANHDTAMAGEILSTLQATMTSFDVHHHEEEPKQSFTLSTRLGDKNNSQNHKLDEANGTDMKTNEVPATVGGLPGTIERGIDDFLMKMLGDGFQLDMNVIHEVLGACGYDVNKSMEMLFDLSASTLEKSDDVLSRASETDSASLSCLDKLENPYLSRSKIKRNKGKTDSEREVLLSLFTTKQSEEAHMKIVPHRRVRRSRAHGTVVTGPPKDPTIEHTTMSVRPLQDSANESEDDKRFENLREAVKEHWDSMREYCLSAAEAYVKGDRDRAYRLKEQGQFFRRMAQEADEKSMLVLIETDNGCRDEEVLLDLTIHKPKEAVKLLSMQLSSLCGIPNIPYIKVKVGNGDGQERLRKRWILKYLEKKEVKWSESENGQMISIRVDEIDSESLGALK